jgi:hypothetical protein
MAENESIETPAELGNRYLGELQALVDDGEISLSVAQRILDDLFVPATPGDQPRLKWSVWCAHVEDQQQLSAIWRMIGN